jgi:hypothetical protein
MTSQIGACQQAIAIADFLVIGPIDGGEQVNGLTQPGHAVPQLGETGVTLQSLSLEAIQTPQALLTEGRVAAILGGFPQM